MEFGGTSKKNLLVVENREISINQSTCKDGVIVSTLFHITSTGGVTQRLIYHIRDSFSHKIKGEYTGKIIILIFMPED